MKSRARAAGQFEAIDFVVFFEEAATMHAAMRSLGFVLRPMARAFRDGAWLTVRLVWRREQDRESAVLALRMRIGR